MMYELENAAACNLSSVEMLLIAGVEPSEFYEDKNEDRD